MPTIERSRKKSDFDYAAYFREILTLQDLTVLPQDKSWTMSPPLEPEPHKVVLYLGCNVLRTSHMIRTVTDIFDLLGLDYVAVGGPAYCCGIVHHRFGDVELAQTMGLSAVKHLERLQPERVVMWCPSCIFYYDEVFQVPASFQTQHVTEFLAESIADFKFVREVPHRVALHHHSDRPRRLSEAAAARKLLAAVPGLSVVDIGSDERLQRACSGFVQEAIGPDTWRGIIEGQIRHAGEEGAAIFATLYHGCQRLICAFEGSGSPAIEHYLSVFARALGIDHADEYKKHRLWRDPDRIFADMAPCMQTNSVGEDAARKAIGREFPSQ